MPPRTYYAPRKIKRGRNGVYTTHTARKLRRRNAYRVALAKGKEYGKDALWGAVFFTSIWVGILVVVIGGLVLFG